jgi:hypothetical protein
MKRITAPIPARAGSKGVPGKNIKIQQDYENILDFLLKNPYIIDINWHRETDWTDNQNKTIKTLKQII